MTYPEKVKYLEDVIDQLENEVETLRMQLVARGASRDEQPQVYENIGENPSPEEGIERLKALNAELLEALEDCRDVLEDYGHITPFHQALEQARAVIAKAKGES